MYAYMKWFIVLFGILYVIIWSWRLPTWVETIIFGGLGVLLFLLAVAVIGERIRRLIEGYYVYMSGGAEDGDLIYKEGGKTLRLYFKRPTRTIYVPSVTKWMESMPVWAKEGRMSIMNRVKSQVGRHWKFEDTDRQAYILNQE